MAEVDRKPQAQERGARMLHTALGPAIARFLEDPMPVEVMLNPDGRLWVDRLSEGLSDTSATLSPADGERIVLRHLASDRSVFARGELKAALWAQGRAHGEYDMAAVLGL